ncbi:MAG: lipoate--protein ligase [Planctomycetia bacterium]|nr:lipoate--protein ligase [Planctomycetia bacterium]
MDCLSEIIGSVMLFIENNNVNPCFNLAVEDFFLNKSDLEETVFLLWRNEKTIVVGKNQNTYEEINSDFVDRHKIQVVRRLTGGGAVYHDLGNLNYSFITQDNGIGFDFSFFTKPVCSALKKWEINAELTGRNDLTINGQKFSGNAQIRQKGRLLHHGTLLFQSCCDDIQQALRVEPDKFQSKAVASIRSRVTNIAEHLSEPFIKNDIESFRQLLLQEITELTSNNLTIRAFKPDELQEICRIQKERYESWDWNFGKSPKFDWRVSHRFPWGKFDLRLKIEKGIISNAIVFGDFFAADSPQILADRLIGLPIDRKTIRQNLSDSFLQTVFPLLTLNEFIELF